jgi:hypothetical protein
MLNEQEEEVVETVEEVNTEINEQTDSTDEGEAPKAEATERQPETSEQRIARLKRQLEREERKLGIESKEDRKEGGEKSSKEVDERYERLLLKTEGITSKKEQDVVLDYARFKGIEPEAALKMPAVKAELAELRKKDSVPAPSSRTSAGGSNDFNYWVAQAKKGNFPRHDREMMRKLKDARIFTR